MAARRCCWSPTTWRICASAHGCSSWSRVDWSRSTISRPGTGKFDLSLQSTYGLAPMVGAWLIVSPDGQGLGTNWNPFLGIAIVLLVGLVVGAFNGFLVIKLGFNAFIFTLAMLILLMGIQVGIVSGRTIYHLPDEFIYLEIGRAHV